MTMPYSGIVIDNTTLLYNYLLFILQLKKFLFIPGVAEGNILCISLHIYVNLLFSEHFTQIHISPCPILTISMRDFPFCTNIMSTFTHITECLHGLKFASFFIYF